MRKILFCGLLLTMPVLAYSGTEPETFCDTEVSYSDFSSYKHCKKGDLVKVDVYDLPRRCSMMDRVIVLNDKFLCVYRGESRTIRSRPVTDVEKAFREEQLRVGGEKFRYEEASKPKSR